MRIAIALFLVACGETGQDRVEFPVHAIASEATTFDVDGWTVSLERAELGFGPIWFCATSFADVDVCPQSEAEWLGTTTIDLRDPNMQMLGTADAVTATIRSAMYDYGVSWLRTQQRPSGRDGSPEGHSAIFIARADDGTRSIEVHATIDVQPPLAGRSAVIGASVGEHEIDGREALIVHFDAIAWWRRVDFARIADADDGDGVVTLVRGDPDYEALVIGMTTAALPTFEWASPE